MNDTQMRAVVAAIEANVPVLMWGPPGIGKTARMEALADAGGLRIETVIASIREPSDFAGLPVRTDQGVTLCPPSWANRLANDDRPGLLFLDELSTAPPAVQAALLRVVQERTVGDLTLPDRVAVVAAANPPEIAADGWELPAPTATRFLHVTLSVDHDYRKAWTQALMVGFTASAQTVTPPRGVGVVPADRLSVERASVAGFIAAHTTRLFDLPEEASALGKPWPCPRSWDNTSRVLACVAPDDDATRQQVVRGLVGEAAGIEYLTWRKHLDLPDPEEVLSGVYVIDWNDNRDDRLFVILGSMVAACVADPTEERWTAAWERLAGAIPAGKLDVALPHTAALTQVMPPGKVLLPETVGDFFDPIERAGLDRVA